MTRARGIYESRRRSLRMAIWFWRAGKGRALWAARYRLPDRLGPASITSWAVERIRRLPSSLLECAILLVALCARDGAGRVVEFGQIDDRFDDPLSCFLIQIHQEFDRKIFLFLGRIGGHEDRREVPWFAVEVSPSLFMVCERGAKPFPHVFDVPGHRAFANPALGGERGAAWEPAPSDLWTGQYR